jgi:DNA-binding PucR family transcriptional regulator
VIDGDLVGLLRDGCRAEVAYAVGVGPARPLERLAESFALATRALDTARAFGLTGLQDLDALGLLPAVLADEAVGESLRRRYLEPLAGARGEIAASLLTLLECDMHVERAAERLFVHPNTVRYRIGRFEELTGATLRDPRTAFEVWWALRWSGLQRDS